MKHPSGDLAPEEAIRVKAYEIWLSRGCPHGTEKQDWIEAERYFESLAPESSTSKDEHPSLTEPEKPASEPAALLVAHDTGCYGEGELQTKASGTAKRSATKRSSRPVSSDTGSEPPTAASHADAAPSSLAEGSAKRRRGAGLAAPQPAPESSAPGSGRREKPTPGPRTASEKPPTDAAPDSRPSVASARPRRKGAEPRTSGRRR